MEFKVLGPLEITMDGQKFGPGAPKVRKVLALLALRADQMVTVDSLIDEIWGENPPRTCVTTAQTYIYHLRRFLVKITGSPSAENMIETAPPGYILRVEGDGVDARRFDELVAKAQASRAAMRLHDAADQAAAALRLWNGQPLSNVPCGTLLRNHATHLEECRLAATELWVRVNMQLGNHREMIAELRSLVAHHPYNEWFHDQLMTALYQAGRRNDALQAYRNVRTLLRDELGLEPSNALRRLHQEILSATPRLATAPLVDA